MEKTEAGQNRRRDVKFRHYFTFSVCEGARWISSKYPHDIFNLAALSV